ncbi:MAG: hypothetical protein COA52_00460 [Hyphomicrobiales bacterium]|nr:MAG: hypothetical protein COA52_00460 [Hyphomicrobiales bacterium]
MAWVKTDEVSMLWKNNSPIMSYFDIRDSLIEEMQKYAPKYEDLELIPKTHRENNLLVLDAADIHIGKLSKTDETGYEYNIQLAVDRVESGINDLINRANYAFNPEKTVFVIGNDVLHIDRPHRTTTAGTPQDTDGQWWEMYMAAKMCYIKCIEKLTQLGPVHVVFCPSNHDYTSGYMLADSISSWFHNVKNVSFGEDNKNISIAHRKYIVYGNNLIGFTHGDGAKEKDLANLMQYEAREAWGKTKYAYIYTHHTHHKHKKNNNQLVEKDYTGITVLSPSRDHNPEHNVYIETVRSPSPPDGWHSRNGYVNQTAIEAFIHNEIDGQIGRLTHYY